MRKFFCRVIATVTIMCCLCMGIEAAKTDVVSYAYTGGGVDSIAILRASGAFDKSLNPYTRSKGDTDFPLEAGETVRIYATYSPSNANLDIGLVGPDGIFHFVSAKSGIFDATFEIPERGNYRLGIKNNSNIIVSIVGFVKY